MMSITAELFQRALQCHQAGNLGQAEQLYRHVLEADPTHAETHHLLGLVAHQTGRPDLAIALLRQAVVLNAASEGTLVNFGVVLISANQFADAASCFQRALALDPAHVEAHLNLGNSLLAQGKPGEAITSYRAVLQLNPQHVHAYNNLGAALQSQGQLDEAIVVLRQALHLDPTYVRALFVLGTIYQDRRQATEALACYRQVAVLDPRHVENHVRLGNAFWELGRLDDSCTHYRLALHSNPNHTDAAYNLANALGEQGRLLEAVPFYEQTLRLNPAHVDARGNLATALMRLGSINQALQQNDEILGAFPTDQKALFRRSLLRLTQGDLENGWHDYEQRLTMPNIAPPSSGHPAWDGTSLIGKTILVYAEQGFGDAIQFIRYLPLVKSRGGTVLFECEPALLDLLAGFPGVDRFIAKGSALPPHDVKAALLSLPGIFKTTLATIPAPVPYLAASPKRIQHWAEVIRHGPGGEATLDFKIGIVWQGNPGFGGDQFRSIPLEHFAAVARVPGVRLISLQKGPGLNQLTAFTERYPVLDLGNQLATFEDTAAAIMNLDLVISSCTSVPHLAGALGAPVWVALQKTPDWRWLLERPDSPWYPTMRLFRQNRAGDWSDVFERIADALRFTLAKRQQLGAMG